MASQRQILKDMVKGAVIRVQHINYPPSSVRHIYRLSSTGETIKESTVRRLEADCLIRPVADGLFGNDGPVQTYVLWRASEGGA